MNADLKKAAIVLASTIIAIPGLSVLVNSLSGNRLGFLLIFIPLLLLIPISIIVISAWYSWRHGFTYLLAIVTMIAFLVPMIGIYSLYAWTYLVAYGAISIVASALSCQIASLMRSRSARDHRDDRTRP